MVQNLPEIDGVRAPPREARRTSQPALNQPNPFAIGKRGGYPALLSQRGSTAGVPLRDYAESTYARDIISSLRRSRGIQQVRIESNPDRASKLQVPLIKQFNKALERPPGTTLGPSLRDSFDPAGYRSLSQTMRQVGQMQETKTPPTPPAGGALA